LRRDFLGRHADAGVADDDRYPAVVDAKRFDRDTCRRRRELDGVGNEIGEDLAQLDAVAANAGRS
jgi:hypothetical protein